MAGFLISAFFLLLLPLANPMGVKAAATYVATFHSVGLYWNPGRSGDCLVNYRQVGTSTWKEGYPLWYDSRNAECRGSLVHLTANTSYEIQLSSGSNSTSLVAATWSETFPVSQTIYVDNTTSTYTISQSGGFDGSKCTGYVKYVPRVSGGINIDVQNNSNYNMVANASCVIISGFKLVGGARGGIYLGSTTHDVVIENNEISNWGNGQNTWGYGAIQGAGSYSSVNPEMKRIIVSRNKFYNPRGGSNDWCNGAVEPNCTTHPNGPQVIELMNSGGNHVFRYNEAFSGSTDHYFNDIFGAGANRSSECTNSDLCTGFPGPDSDIYGNYLANNWDDAIEADGKGRNIRIWGNYLDQNFVKISVAEARVGPVYVWRNVVGTASGGVNKNGGESFIKGGDGGGRVYVFHNTLLQPNGVTGGIADAGGDMSNLISRNNILQLRSVNRSSIRDTGGAQNYDVDYDYYNGTVVLNNTPTTEVHGLRFAGSPGFEAQSFDPVTGRGRFYLTRASAGYDGQGMANVPCSVTTRLPNFNTSLSDSRYNFTGSCPDSGAHEAGTAEMEFGVNAYRVGETTPAPAMGDANGDGRVDGIDFVVWLNHYGADTPNRNRDGDFDSDGKVDGIDYIVWLNNYSA